MTKILTPTKLSTDLFTYDAEENCFVAEQSDLGGSLRFNPVYEGKGAGGLPLVSSRTGRLVVFELAHQERDTEGELLYLEFEVVAGQEDLNARAAHDLGITVRIFND